MADDVGRRIALLDSVPEDDPFVRLELVAEIAGAIMLQHFPLRNAPDGTAATPDGVDDDTRRARQALRHGFKTMAVYRYATALGVSPALRPPPKLIQQSLVRRRGEPGMRRAFSSNEFGLWHAMPVYIGAFFVDSLVGRTRPMDGVDPAFIRPPGTTMEFFRPRWYDDATLWRPQPVSSDFADELLDTPPLLTDVLGIAGLVPMLTKWYSVDVAKSLAGGWAGDRWAIWEFADGTEAVLLEINWQDEESAIQFRDAMPNHPRWRVMRHEAGSTRVRVLRAQSPEAMDRLLTAVQASK